MLKRKNSLKVNKYFLLYYFLILIISFFLTFLATSVINNPDIGSYLDILMSADELGFSLEPVVGIISLISRWMSLITGLDSLYLFYFIHLILINFFIFYSFKNIFNSRVVVAFFALLSWLLAYGVIHSLIQVRFGLANAIFLYIFSLLFIRSSFAKTLIFGTFATFTHYSSILAVFSLFFIKFRKVTYNIESYKIIHVGFAILLLLFKFGAIFSFLPEVMLGRISGYIGNNYVDQVSVFSIYISFFCYVVLILSPRFEDDKINYLKIYGALGFLPYFMVPELEIIIRLGIPFQYLLLPYLFLTFKKRSVLLSTTIPLLMFFSYKIYSNINSFLGYL